MLILHIDFDSFFASITQQDEPRYRGKPIAVAGKKSVSKNPIPRSVVAAASIEAKRFGVKSAMSTYEAKKLCPQILFVPPSPKRYHEVHNIFVDMLEKYTPLLEIFSIDEVFLEVTDTAQRFGGVSAIVSKFKRDLKERVGEYITCSVGVSHNKLLAKLASKMNKPNGLTFIEEKDVSGILEKIKLEDLCGIGPRISERLKKMGIETVSQLGEGAESLLLGEFKSYGRTLKLMGQGKDFSPVVPYWQGAEPKSMGHSYTLPRYINTFEKAKPILKRLCEMVACRLRSGGLGGRTVHLYIRREDFRGWGRQMSLAYPTAEGGKIFEVCLRIYRPNLDGSTHRSTPTIRLIGVSVSNLSKKYQQPLPLFPQQRRWEKLTEVMDDLNNHYGEEVLFRAALLESKNEIKEIAGYYGQGIK